ncbi:hypothetical protein N7493_009427 [Penicillium malachiteum]|uniref:Mitochondrial division protein 1 n=1 Tax=Penicillium malachiteum TaxID=1324776 RepID=A0AAD6MS65_9EURO|nr:hypothetical protein N7493_009427 [Penicillium malachiteum]
MSKALLFLQEHFLHWMESMSILGYISDIMGSIDLLQKATTDVGDALLSEFLHDAKRFTLKIIGLPRLRLSRFTALDSYSHREMRQSTDNSMQSFLNVVVGYRKLRKIGLWDSATGLLLNTLEGHLGQVLSLTFSPNGQLLVSASIDNTIRIWDVAVGVLQKTLEGHSDRVSSVAFSPNDQLLASGSDDKTIQLWDLETGAQRRIINGHLNWVSSVAFSTDDRLVVSSSEDRTIRLWDLVTGELQQTMIVNGHVNYIEVSETSSILSTNLGAFKIQVKFEHGNRALKPRTTNQEISIEEGQWLKLNETITFWLPPGYRPTCAAVESNLVALGHASAQISFIGFCA